MSYFLGILPDDKARGRMASILPQYTSIFDSQEIPVYYPDLSKYHLTLLYLGDSISLYRRLKLFRTLRKFRYKSFEATVTAVKLGYSQRRNPGLLYLSVTDTNNDLRNIVSQIASSLGVKREDAFIPHITIGRVGKDLTAHEYINLVEAVSNVNKLVFTDVEIAFTPRKIVLIKSEGGKYTVIREFQIFP